MEQRRVKQIMMTLALVAIAGCSDSWEGFVYPNRNDLTRHRNLGKFESLEACRVSALGFLAEIKALDSGDYEFGKIATTVPISLVSNFAKKPFDSLQLGLAIDGATKR